MGLTVKKTKTPSGGKNEIHADGVENFFARAHKVMRKLDKGERIEPVTSITFSDPEMMFDVLTSQRRKLIVAVQQEPQSITGLAHRLERNVSAVRRDVKLLVEYGVVRTQEQDNDGHGKLKMVFPAAKKIHLQATL